ncbi:MAG: S1 family peptidase, partial [Gammaproteobacteria bacterium]|nr:S1 family peptidase [Gammaproteobacteria bacterium]
LTNRHVVQAGPVTAEALFANREEVELKPLYRDPVHDFGVFQYDPADLKFIKPAALNLRPDKARSGRDIRVIGNDAGEQLSILAGTLARLDRSAPNYGMGRYNDFNTFYYQSASGVSGGSSGSPVVDIKGDVLALNAGGNRNAASSFFLPLERVLRAVKLIQAGKPVSRGTLQTTFSYQPYDEVRRLGLRPGIEAQLRKVNHGDGLLVVSQTMPRGPADGLLKPGDIVLKGWAGKKKTQWLRRFDELEALLDDHVNQTITLLLERQGQPVEVKLKVADLHAITPSRYVEFGEAVVHDLSYQQARHLNRAVEGVYVAQPGYVFSTAGIPFGAIILSLDNQPVANLAEFEKVLATLADGQQAMIRYITFQESRRTHVSVMTMDRRWFPMQTCYRDDESGLWPCQPLAQGPVARIQPVADVEPVKYKDRRRSRLSSSMVTVHFNMPYHIDGVQEAHYVGSGLVIDADEGLVVVDRNTIPVAMGNVRLVFAGAAEIPGQVLFVHPLHNLAIVKYQPEYLGSVKIQSASLKSEVLQPGDELWLVGTRADQNLVAEKKMVASIDPLEFSIPKIPVFRESNLDVISINNAPFTHGGVLADDDAKVLAIWASFSYGSGNELKQFEWGIPIELVQELLEQWRCCKQFKLRSLEVELATLSFVQARQLGLTDHWFERFQDTDQKRQVLAISRLVADSDASHKLQEGDLLVAIDGVMVRTFRDVEKLSQKDQPELTIIRAGEQKTLVVATRDLNVKGTSRIVQWAGALIQDPHRAVSAQRGAKTESVYVSFVWWGSPASRYELSAINRIIEFEGQPVASLNDFIALATTHKNKKFIQLKVLDLLERESVITLKPNQHYWPTREVYFDGEQWQSRLL